MDIKNKGNELCEECGEPFKVFWREVSETSFVCKTVIDEGTEKQKWVCPKCYKFLKNTVY